MSQGHPGSQPAQVTNSGRAQQGNMTRSSQMNDYPQGQTSVLDRPTTSTSPSDELQPSTTSSTSQTGTQAQGQIISTEPPTPARPSVSNRAQKGTMSSGSKTRIDPRDQTFSRVPPEPSTGTPTSVRAQQSTASPGSQTGAQVRDQMSYRHDSERLTTSTLGQTHQSTTSFGSQTGTQARGQIISTEPPTPPRPSVSNQAQKGTMSSGSKTIIDPRDQTFSRVPPEPSTGTPTSVRAQQSTASPGSQTGAQVRDQMSYRHDSERLTTSTLGQTHQSTTSFGLQTGAQARGQMISTKPPRPARPSVSNRAQQGTTSCSSQRAIESRNQAFFTVPPGPGTGTPTSVRAQQSTALPGTQTYVQPQNQTSCTEPPRPMTDTLASGGQTLQSAAARRLQTVPRALDNEFRDTSNAVDPAQRATGSTTTGTSFPDTRLEDISSPRRQQLPRIPAKSNIAPSSFPSRTPNRSAHEIMEHLSPFQSQGADEPSFPSSYESVSSRRVAGNRPQRPFRSFRPSTDAGRGDNLGGSAAAPTAPSIAPPTISSPTRDGDVGHQIIFLDGARSPPRLLLEEPSGSERGGILWAANDGDKQLRVRRSPKESLDPNVTTLEVQSVSNFRPLHFFMRLLYVYSIFQLSVFIVILTLSLLHQIAAGTILGKTTEKLKIPLFIQVVHVVSHLLCIIVRVFLDIFSNFQYIQFLLPSVDTGSQHAKEVLCDLIFAFTLISCPILTLGGTLLSKSNWSDAISYTQLVSVIGAAGICFVYFIEHIGTTWLIIREFRKVCDGGNSNGGSAQAATRRNVCQRAFTSLFLVVEKRLTYSLSSIRTESKEDGQQDRDQAQVQKDPVTFGSYPAIIQFLYTNPDFDEITTVTEMTYAELIQPRAGRQNSLTVNGNERANMTDDSGDTNSAYDGDDDDDGLNANQGIENCRPVRFGRGSSCIAVFTSLLEMLVPLSILGFLAMIATAGYISLGKSTGAIIMMVVAGVGGITKFGGVDRCQKLLSSSPKDFRSHLMWILCPIDTGAVVRNSKPFERFRIFNWCASPPPAATAVKRTWMAKPKARFLWTVFWVCISISLSFTIACITKTKIENEGQDWRNWAGLAAGISLSSFILFALDPEGWVYLTRQNDFKKVLQVKVHNNDGIQTSEQAKVHHWFENLSWMRKQRLVYALMLFLSAGYVVAMRTMYQNMEPFDAETTNLRVQSVGAEGGHETLGYCNVQTVWNASEDIGLSLVDFGVLAALAYEPHSDDTKDVLTAWFSDSASGVTMWESSAYPEACGRPGAITRLFDVTPSSGGPARTVLSIRGTVDFKDWFEDIALWGPVMIADIASQILPFGTSWESMIPNFLRATRIFNAGSYALELTDCVRELKSNVTARNSRLFLTGHSLGGGLASLLGAREDIPNAVFSAPGSELSIGLLAEDKLDELRRNTINVIPDGDLVPHVDRSAFYAQKIECTDTSLLRPIECHSIVRTVNTLAELCGATYRLLTENEIPP